MTESRRRRARRWYIAVAVVLAVGACTGGDEPADEAAPPTPSPTGSAVPSGDATSPPTTQTPAPTTPPPLPRVAVPDSRQSGVYRGACELDAAAEFGRWRGRPVERLTQFLDDESWETISRPSWHLDCLDGVPVPVVLSVPLLPDDDSVSLQDGAMGAYDEHFSALARYLVEHGFGEATLRLGWEMNGGWYRWSAVSDPGAFVDYWRRVVDAMRAVPGAEFSFTWSPSLNGGEHMFDPESAYPGDDYVDVIGGSIYDMAHGDDSGTPESRWRDLVEEPAGLQWQVDFAAAHDKPIAFEEWGLAVPEAADGGGGGDNPLFIERIHDWVTEHDVLYETYFERDHSASMRHTMLDGPGVGPHFPEAAERYRELFGRTPWWRQGAAAD